MVNEASAQDAAALFAGPGEVRALARVLDWSSSPLGLTTGWSPAVRMMVRSMFDSPFPICLWTGPHYALIYNDAYRRILVAKHPASLGQPGSVVWAEIWEELKPQFDGVRQNGEVIHFEDAPFVMARLDGGGTETAWFNYSLSPLRNEDGSIAAVLNITPETTSRVLLQRRLDDEQAALAASEERLRRQVLVAQADAERVQLALSAGAIIGTWFWDLPTDRFAVDEAFATAFGLDPGLGREGIPLAQIVATVHPDDQAGLAEAINEAVRRGGRYAHQYRVFRRDGQYHWLEANGHVEHGPDGTPLRFPGVLIDVEERRAVEAERERAVAQLRTLNDTLELRVAERTSELMQTAETLRQSQKMEAVGQLTGGLAHDFNNLLTVVTGSLELMAIRLGRGRYDDLGRFMAAAQTAAKRASALTHRLLAFSRRQTLDPKVTALNDLVGGMQDMVNRTAGPEITVEFVSAPALWTTFVDPNQLENALLNLCINARDAMPDGGQLTVQTSNQEMGEGIAAVRDLPPGEYVALSVSDTGTGMSPELIERVFEPFFTTKPTGQGTGLGLSMVYGFARQSDGQVRIHSEVGYGTTVTIYLPRSEKTAAAADVSVVPTPQSAERGQMILVVDDEAAVRMLVRDVLQDLGYGVIEAESGQAALKILQGRDRIDLLVTDVGMPGMNGRQLADAARTNRPHLKTLFITGYAEASVVSHGHLDADMAIMTKPFALDVLANKVKGMIDAPVKDSRSPP